ncbi:hypothetical protein NL676_024130 [Syzygium grande]|nr:hypothetical protein NL676_024130 [Syzygium grande]
MECFFGLSSQGQNMNKLQQPAASSEEKDTVLVLTLKWLRDECNLQHSEGDACIKYLSLISMLPSGGLSCLKAAKLKTYGMN